MAPALEQAQRLPFKVAGGSHKAALQRIQLKESLGEGPLDHRNLLLWLCGSIFKVTLSILLHSFKHGQAGPFLSGEVLLRHSQRPQEGIGLLLPDCLEVCLQSDFSPSCCSPV